MHTLFFYWRKIGLCWNQFISLIWLKIRVQKATMISFNFLLPPPRVSDAYFKQHWFSCSLVSGTLAHGILGTCFYQKSNLDSFRKAGCFALDHWGVLSGWPASSFTSDVSCEVPLYCSSHSLNRENLPTSLSVLLLLNSHNLFVSSNMKIIKWPKGHMGI